MFTNRSGATHNFGSLKVSSLLVLVLVFVMLATTVAGCVQNARSVSGLKNQNRSAPWRLPVPSHSSPALRWIALLWLGLVKPSTLTEIHGLSSCVRFRWLHDFQHPYSLLWYRICKRPNGQAILAEVFMVPLSSLFISLSFSRKITLLR